MDEQAVDELLAHASAARERAYAPYSTYRVGAALRTADGEIYTGCNIENAAYSMTAHAEMVAYWSAVADGYREFTALAIATDGRNGEAPCAFCRQVLMEHCPTEMPVYSLDGDGPDDVGEYESWVFGELYPEAFGPEDLGVDPGWGLPPSTRSQIHRDGGGGA